MLAEGVIDFQVVRSHALRGETLLEAGADGFPVERQKLGNSLRSFLNARDDAPGQPVFDDLRDRSTAEGKHRCSARHGLDHDQSEVRSR